MEPDIAISKVLYNESGTQILEMEIYDVVFGFLKNRRRVRKFDVIQYLRSNKKVISVRRNINGRWDKIEDIILNPNSLIHDNIQALPQLITKRNVFISYYHLEDENYRNAFENMFGDLFINQSVKKDEIDSENGDEYISHLIHDGCLKDTTVLVVLVGPNTKNRKHVDWEIAGALDYKVGDCYAGLIGLLLPNHPDFGHGVTWKKGNSPQRLEANLLSGYATLYDWTSNRIKMQNYIESAFTKRRFAKSHLVNRAIPQMTYNKII